MDSTFYTTLSVLLFEITIVLIIIIVILVKRLRALKLVANGVSRSGNANKDTFLAYIQKVIQHTEERVKELATKEADLDQAAIEKRLEMLRSESLIMNSLNHKNKSEEYWKFVAEQYANSVSDKNQEKNSSNKEKIYLSRIKNLEDFKGLFFKAQNKLIESFQTIEKLRAIANVKPSPDTAALINTINEIENEKKQIQEKLDLAESEFNKMFDATEVTESSDIQEELDNFKEENEFLVKQIDHLLKQEVEGTEKLLARIESLEDGLKTKEAECKELAGRLV